MMRFNQRTYGKFFSLLLTAAILLAGCGTGSEGTAGQADSPKPPAPAQVIDWRSYQMPTPQRTEEGEQWYLTEYHNDWITPCESAYDRSENARIGTIDAAIYSNWQYQSGSVEGNDLQAADYLDCYDTKTGQASHMELDLGGYGLQEGVFLWSMDMVDDRQAVFLLRGIGECDTPIPYAALLFYHLDEGVEEALDLLPILASVGIENELSEKDYLFRQSKILCDRDGCYYLLWNNNLLILSDTGELLCHMEGTGDLPPFYLCKTPEGFPLFAFPGPGNKTSDYRIYDHSTGELRSLGESKYFPLRGSCMDTAGNLYYFSDTCNIVRWNILSGKREKIFDCKANMLNTNTISDKILTVNENGDLAVMDPQNSTQNIFVLSSIPPAESRTLTLVSATRGESIIPSAATLFSTRNPGVTIEVSSFETSGSDDLDAYTTNLLNRVVAGDAPDIFVVSAETMYALYEKGALADLTDAIPADTREQVFNCIWNAGTIDGKLMGLTTDQITYSILVSDELWAQDIWTLEDVLEAADKTSGDTFKGLVPLTKYDPTPLTWLALYDIESSLVDRESGTCHFDSELFRRLLEYCKNNYIMEQNSVQDTMVTRAVIDGEYLAYAYDNYFGFPEFCNRMSLFPENYHWVGIPTDGDSGNLIYARDFLVVNKNTENMDLIAEFLPTLYGDELIRLYPNHCLRRDVLRERVEDAYPGEQWAHFNMGNGVYRGLKCKPDGTSYVEDYIAFMDSCVLMPPEDSVIADIVLEETAPYFAGDKDMDTVIDIIQSRVQLYLDENGS